MYMIPGMFGAPLKALSGYLPPATSQDFDRNNFVQHTLYEVIRVDFDGTIVKHRYPKIGEEIPFAIDTLKALQKDGHLIIMWTFRAGERLDEAVQFCRDRGFEFYAINRSYPEEVFV